MPTSFFDTSPRIEVIANGLPLWGRAQLAVDTTLVSPLDSPNARGATSAARKEPHSVSRETVCKQHGSRYRHQGGGDAGRNKKKRGCRSNRSFRP